MKSLAFYILAVLSAQFVQAQLFGPTGRVATPIFRAAAPAPGPSNAPIYTTTTVLGAAIGGIIGSKSDKGTEGAALGGAVRRYAEAVQAAVILPGPLVLVELAALA